MQNRPDFIQGLKDIKSSLAQITQENIEEGEILIGADFQLASAIQQAKKQEPEKGVIVSPLENAKELVAGITAVADLINRLDRLIESTAKVFNCPQLHR